MKILKFGCFGLIGLFVFLVVIGFIFGNDSTEPVVSVEETDKSNIDTKVEKADQKEYYLANTKPKLEEVIGVYDKIWAEGWQPTFEALSNANANVYTAYDNIQIVRDTYRDLSTVFKSIPTKGLSKEHQKQLNSAFRDLGYAAVSRQLAAEKAMEMIDAGNYSPSEMNKIKEQIDSADSQMISGVVTITTVESELGIIEEENQ